MAIYGQYGLCIYGRLVDNGSVVQLWATGCCRYFQMVGMKRRRVLYRLNTLALFLAFAATHILSVLYVLHMHCRTQRLPWHKAVVGWATPPECILILDLQLSLMQHLGNLHLHIPWQCLKAVQSWDVQVQVSCMNGTRLVVSWPR